MGVERQPDPGRPLWAKSTVHVVLSFSETCLGKSRSSALRENKLQEVVWPLAQFL